ncbi:DHH family phosphoesterase [Exiguobacterium acetylicum]|uniref:DHH family phosphoesterase n=1 Tax=Exiguobacterium acetylicum TaxID=41170 RepID=UPI001EE323C3|nr:bifunctional oligoribonuclease/PAP phosphatase NrnA [Exiguobacterium acetylicum]UKS55329.1 bifunctional oligoribonuclease/PAP phosphatase NrnA [Exiguobacterium acetylicum]
MKEQIKQLIEAADTIIIHRHERPDPDALGSQFGLQLTLQHQFPSKTILSAGEMATSLSFMGELDQVDEVLYKEALVVILDTANQARIDGKLAMTGKNVIKIDHHPDEDPYAPVQLVDTTMSSTSELLVHVLNEWGYDIPTAAAIQFYAGIVGDTGRFQFRGTTKRTFEVAAQLIDAGIDTDWLYRNMYEMELAALHVQGYVLQHIQLTDQGVGYVVLTQDTLKQFGATVEQASLLVNSFAGLKGMKCWALFLETDKEVRIRIRSKGPVINEVAKEFNGGGHPMASGATIGQLSEVERVVRRLDEVAANFQF